MRRVAAGAALLAVLSLSACGSSQPEYVTPPSCIKALDINAELFTYLGDGDLDGYIEYGNRIMPELQEAAQDCRSKGVDSQSA